MENTTQRRGAEMSKYARRVDGNQLKITKELRDAGLVVVDMHNVGGGFPDLLVIYGRKVVLVEVKSSPKERLTPAQVKFHEDWTPSEIIIAWNSKMILDRIGVKK